MYNDILTKALSSLPKGIIKRANANPKSRSADTATNILSSITGVPHGECRRFLSDLVIDTDIDVPEVKEVFWEVDKELEDVPDNLLDAGE